MNNILHSAQLAYPEIRNAGLQWKHFSKQQNLILGRHGGSFQHEENHHLHNLVPPTQVLVDNNRCSRKKKNETLNLVDTSLLGIYQAHVPKQEFEYVQVGQQKRQIYQHQIKQFIPQSSWVRLAKALINLRVGLNLRFWFLFWDQNRENLRRFCAGHFGYNPLVREADWHLAKISISSYSKHNEKSQRRAVNECIFMYLGVCVFMYLEIFN